MRLQFAGIISQNSILSGRFAPVGCGKSTSSTIHAKQDLSWLVAYRVLGEQLPIASPAFLMVALKIS